MGRFRAASGIPDQYKDPLRHLFDLKADDAAGLLDALRAASPAISSAHLARAIAGRTTLDVDSLSSILDLLLSLVISAEKYELEPEQIVDDVFRRAEREEIKPQEDDRERVRKLLLDLLTIQNSIVPTARALDILTEHERLFVSARILSDIRPVFTSDLSEVVGAVIVHNLKVEAHHNNDHEQLVFALDSLDLVKLRSLIDRALRKEEVMKKAIEKSGVSFIPVDDPPDGGE